MLDQTSDERRRLDFERRKRELDAGVIVRAWSTLTVKQTDDDERVIEGIATTPATDSYGDIVEPKGAEFTLPLPLLSQHDSKSPIGHVTKVKIKESGIDVRATLVKVFEGAPAKWAERIEIAWADIKSGLVRGLSIGFKPLEYTFMDDGSYGIHFLRWKWVELSSVTIPANSEATVTSIKSIDLKQRAALGLTLPRSVKLISLPASRDPVAALSKRGGVKLITRRISQHGKENPTGTDQRS
jgi:HK97 family phage prohead protease